MQLEFEVKGKVKAKQSVRFTREGRRYTPGDMVEYANFVRMSFVNEYPAWNMWEFAATPLQVQIDVYMPVPQGFSKVKRAKALAGEIRPIVKPDCDNIVKNINDALNGIAYPDDKQIVSLTVNKHYGNCEYVKIKIADI